MRRRGLIALLLTAAAVAPAAGQQPAPAPDLVVIVHPSLPMTELDRSELAALFRMSRRTWDNGLTVVPFNFPPDHPLRLTFDRLILGLKPNEVSRYWIDQRIRGQGHPPRQIGDPGLVVRLVAQLKGSIGYVPAAMADDSVRVVARISRGQVLPPSSRAAHATLYR